MDGVTAFPLCLIGALVAMLVAQTLTRRPRGPRPRRTSIHRKSHGKRFVIRSLNHPFTTIHNHHSVYFFAFYSVNYLTMLESCFHTLDTDCTIVISHFYCWFALFVLWHTRCNCSWLLCICMYVGWRKPAVTFPVPIRYQSVNSRGSTKRGANNTRGGQKTLFTGTL